MGFLDTMLPVRAEAPPPHDDSWYGDIGQMSLSGVTVTADTALQISAVYRCVAAVAADIAAMPLILYSRQGDARQRAPDHPLYHVLHDQPNQWQTSYEWREMMMGHLLLRGNAYNIIQPGPRGFADQLIPLNPARMKVEQLPSGRLKYVYAWEDGHGEAFTQEEIFHLKGYSADGIMGLSTVTLARQSFGLTMATEQYGARVFAQDGTPGGVLQVEGTLSDEASQRLERSWQQANTGLTRSHHTAVLEKGTTYQQVGLSNEDSQFLGTRGHQIEETARWFGVPLHRIGHTEKSTSWGTGIEQFNLGYIAYTLIPWIKRWEQRIAADLILEPEAFYTEFLMEHLLRGDAAARATMYKELFNLGAISPNEIRARENMNPIEGGDTLFVPMSVTPMKRSIASDGSQSSLQTWRRSTTLQGLIGRKIMTINEAREELGMDPVAWGEEPVDETEDGSGNAGSGGAGALDSPADHRTHLIVQEASAKVVRKEVRAATAALARLDGDIEQYEVWGFTWWADHRAFIQGALYLDGNKADEYIEAHRHLDPDQLDESQDERAYQLAAMALGEERYATV